MRSLHSFTSQIELLTFHAYIHVTRIITHTHTHTNHHHSSAAVFTMSTAAFSPLTTHFITSHTPHHKHQHPLSTFTVSLSTHHFSRTRKFKPLHSPCRPSVITFSGGGGGSGGDAGGGGGGGDSGDGDANDRNKSEAIMALAEANRSLDSIPKDLAAAIEAGRIPGSIINRYLDIEKSPFLGWLLRFGGFKERLLADDLFLTKVAIECGVGIFTKTAAELKKRGDNFNKELDFVCADVIMAIVADFMLVWLPAPTVSLRPALAVTAGGFNKFFYRCPDNAFQLALSGTSYSLLQRVGAFVRNGGKLFLVGSSASLIGTGVTNTLISARKFIDKSFAGEAEDLPVLSTSAAYGVYMSVSSNLRYQIIAGVIEQRILEPLLHKQKLVLSAFCFVVRTGNTFLGSLMWVDFARLIGIQRSRE